MQKQILFYYIPLYTIFLITLIYSTFNNHAQILINTFAQPSMSPTNESYNLLKQWGSHGIGEGQFSGIYDITIGHSNYVYVTDNITFNVDKFDSNGNFIKAWGEAGIGDGKFNNPNGIDVDSKGYVYVVDLGNSRIEVFYPSIAESNNSNRGLFLTENNTCGIVQYCSNPSVISPNNTMTNNKNTIKQPHAGISDQF